MEDRALEEDLKALCRQILEKDKGPQDLSRQLTEAQMLYEKLLILNYLQQQEPKVVQEKPQNKSEIAQAELQNRAMESEKEISSTAREAAPNPATHRESEKTEKQPKLSSNLSDKAERPPSLNDRLAANKIDVGLNDRLAFVKHLFDGSQEDFNRVLSQLNTAENYQEAEDFLQKHVRPDYQWEDKEEYLDRLLQLVDQRFGKEA